MTMTLLRAFYVRLCLLVAPRPLRERRLPAVRAWFVLAIVALWLLAIIAFR